LIVKRFLGFLKVRESKNPVPFFIFEFLFGFCRKKVLVNLLITTQTATGYIVNLMLHKRIIKRGD